MSEQEQDKKDAGPQDAGSKEPVKVTVPPRKGRTFGGTGVEKRG
jgi:hypothetical protein